MAKGTQLVCPECGAEGAADLDAGQCPDCGGPLESRTGSNGAASEGAAGEQLVALARWMQATPVEGARAADREEPEGYWYYGPEDALAPARRARLGATLAGLAALILVLIYVIGAPALRSLGGGSSSAGAARVQVRPTADPGPAPQTPAPAAATRCPGCGKSLGSRSVFCPYCGLKIRD